MSSVSRAKLIESGWMAKRLASTQGEVTMVVCNIPDCQASRFDDESEWHLTGKQTAKRHKRIKVVRSEKCPYHDQTASRKVQKKKKKFR